MLDTIPAKDIMTKKVATVTPDSPLKKVVSVMLASHAMTVPVINDKKKVIGIITESDLVTHELEPHVPKSITIIGSVIYLEDPDQYNEELKKACARTAGEIMTSPAVTATEDARLHELVDLMKEKHINRVPIVDKNGKLAGIITRAAILEAITKNQ